MASKEERKRKKIKVVASTVFAAIFIASIVVIGLIFSEKQEKTVEKEWWKTSTIYHIYVPSFKDSNGDGYGDLNGKMIFLSQCLSFLMIRYLKINFSYCHM